MGENFSGLKNKSLILRFKELKTNPYLKESL